jgi:hypothetical protein
MPRAGTIRTVGESGLPRHPRSEKNNCSGCLFTLEKEAVVNKIFGGADVGRKNIGLSLALFLILGVVVGIPLTIDFFGGSILTSDQYQAWKVVHGYGVFLAFINYFFGLYIDRMDMVREQQEISSWSFLLAGLIGGGVRMVLLLFSALDELGIYASLAETALFVIGTFVLVRGQLRQQPGKVRERSREARYSHAR